MEDKAKFKESLSDVYERFDKVPTESTIQRIWKILLPYSDKECIKALDYVYINCRYAKDIVPDLVEKVTPKVCPDWY